MDNKEIYGPIAYRLTFAEAVKQKVMPVQGRGVDSPWKRSYRICS